MTAAWNPWILLICSMTAGLTGILIKKYCVNTAVRIRQFGYYYNTVVSLTAAAVLFLMESFSSVSRFTLLLGFVFGAVTAMQQIFNIRALDSGPLSYTTVICSLSSILPTLCGAVFWDETIAPIQWVGILLMLLCMVLSVEKKEDEKRKNVRWLFYCGVTFLCTGAIGILQKWHQNTEYKDELTPFLIIAFAFSTLTSLAGLLLERNKSPEADGKTTLETDGKPSPEADGKPKKSILITAGLLCAGGVCAALNNKWNLYLSGVMDSAVFFPIVNGGTLVLAALAAFVLFRESLSRKQWVGMIFGILSVIFVCNPFQ